MILAGLVAIGIVLMCTVFRSQLAPYKSEILSYGSLPVVSVLFTYFHIALALQVRCMGEG